MPTFSSAPLVQYGFAFGNGGLNQFLFGGPNQGVQVLSVEGLEGLPNLRTQDTPRGYLDGAFSGRDFLDGRTITFSLQIMNDQNATMQTYLQQLQQYLMPQQSGLNVLQVYLPGGRGIRRIYGRVRRRQITVDPQYVYGKALAMLEFYCPDPRFYNDTATSNTINSLSSNSRTYNRTYNLTYPSTGTAGAGAQSFINNGNYETWPSFSIAPAAGSSTVTGLKVKNLTDPSNIVYLSFPNLNMGSTDTLVVDADLRTILFNGVPSRNLLSSDSRWFSMPAGVTQSIAVESLTGTVNCTVSFRDAFI